MEYSEVKKLLQDPNQLAMGLTELDTLVNGLETTNTALTTQLEEERKNVQQLRDTNMQLYLRATGQPDTGGEPEKTDFENMVEDLKGKKV